jgi:hypothetical protein
VIRRELGDLVVAPREKGDWVVIGRAQGLGLGGGGGAGLEAGEAGGDEGADGGDDVLELGGHGDEGGELLDGVDGGRGDPGLLLGLEEEDEGGDDAG